MNVKIRIVYDSNKITPTLDWDNSRGLQTVLKNVSTHLEMAWHTCVTENCSNFPGDAFVWRESLHFDYSSKEDQTLVTGQRGLIHCGLHIGWPLVQVLACFRWILGNDFSDQNLIIFFLGYLCGKIFIVESAVLFTLPCVKNYISDTLETPYIAVLS